MKDPDWDVRHHYYRPAGLVRFLGDVRGCDLAFSWGGRISMGGFLWATRCLQKKNVVILWCGSDVLRAQEELASGKMDSWVAERIHWAASPVLAEEVRSLGLSCEYVQVSFVHPVSTPLRLPEKFSVLMYVPTIERARIYGLDRILEVADACRSVEFTLVGLREGESVSGPPNLKVYCRTSDLGPYIERATVIWRPVRHDAGISFVVLEALAQGRHVLYSYPFSDCIHVTTNSAVLLELERLRNLHESGQLRLNEGGIRTISQEFAPERVRANLFSRWAEIIGTGARAKAMKSGASQPELSVSNLCHNADRTSIHDPIKQS